MERKSERREAKREMKREERVEERKKEREKERKRTGLKRSHRESLPHDLPSYFSNLTTFLFKVASLVSKLLDAAVCSAKQTRDSTISELGRTVATRCMNMFSAASKFVT